jgi:UDP-glucose 4-epimerase
MKILVFGGNGRLGKDLQSFTAARDDVEMIYTRSPSRSDSKLFPVDVTNEQEVFGAVERFAPSVILHLASITGPAADATPLLARAVNVTSMAHVVSAATAFDVDRIVFVSSSGVYGDQYSKPINELGPLAPNSFYAQTKVDAETLLRDAAHAKLVPEAVILRVFNIYGDRFDGSLVTRLLRSSPDSPVALRGPENFVRDYIHVNSVMPALVASLHRPVNVPVATYNIGSGIPMSNGDLVARLSRTNEIHTVTTPGSRSYSCADITLAREELGLKSNLRL